MEQGGSQRILVVSASLPYNIKRLSSQPVAVPEPLLIPETVGKSEVPPRRRRRSKASSSVIDIIAELNVSDKAEEFSCPEILSIEADSRHPSFLTQAANLPAIYIGLSEHNSEHELELYERKNCLPVYHPSHAKFEMYCTKVLSRLFHYSLFETRNVDLKLINEGWKDFSQVNQAVADAIMNVFREGDIVWIMDFRMLGVAGHLRDWNKLIPIGLHLNVPFPSSEVFTCLPHAKEVLEAMLGSSVISFQAYSYIRHFVSTSTRLLGLESTPLGIEFNGLPVHLTVVPIGVDVVRIREDVMDEATQSKLEAMRKVFKGKRILLGIDAMETMRGVKHKLQSFEMFLETYPSWIGEVILVQVMSPDSISTQIDPVIVNLAAKINNRFGYLGYNPVSLFNINLQQEEYLALLTIAELFLVISERAAYSIPALDYIVCQEKRHGMIMLSEFIGNTIFQPAAFIINPWDHKRIAESIMEALTMPIIDMMDKEEDLMEFVKMNDVNYWANQFIKDIMDNQALLKQYTTTPSLDRQLVMRQYMISEKRVFLLDYDGTLVGIKKVPQAAAPTPDLIQILENLAKSPNNLVYIISGRDRETLNNWLGHIPGLGLSAEHGCYLKPASHSNENEWRALIKEEDLGWKDEVLSIMENFKDRTVGSFVEQKSASITWHYRLADAEFGSWQAKELQNFIETTIQPRHPIEVLAGKKNIEVRPVSTNKGNIVRILMKEHFWPNFVLCFGDDNTDEDMFKALQEMMEERQDLRDDTAFFTCKIAIDCQTTSAQYTLKSCENVKSLLAKLTTLDQERFSALTM